MIRGRFSSRDADALLEKIRSSYDEFSTRYGKSPLLKDHFEQRYVSALRSRMNLEAFLSAELSAVQDLLGQASRQNDREEQIRLVRMRRKEQREESKRQEVETVAAARPISSYPEYPLNVPSSETIRRLFGAFAHLEREYWPPLDRILRKFFPRNLSWSRVDLENNLFLLASPSEKRLPPVLERYTGVLERSDHDMAVIAKEEHRCMIEASLFCDRFLQTLAQLRSNQGLSYDESRIVLESIEYTEGIVIDFRLQEFLR